MLDLLFYLEQAGVGLPRQEMVLLNLSIRKLASEVPVENIRYSTRAAYARRFYATLHSEIVLHPRFRLLRVFLILIRVHNSGFGVRYSENPRIITCWKRNFRRTNWPGD